MTRTFAIASCAISLAFVVQAEVKVVVPAGADRTVTIAAEEFRRYYGLVTGRQIPITCRPGSADTCIKIGFPSHDAFFNGETDAYAVVSDGDGLAICGKNSRSVLYGVYDFFRVRCGCRWFWDEDVVPKCGKIDFSGVDIREKSRFLYRGCQYFAHRGLTRFQAEHWGLEDWRRELDWCVKNRINVVMLHFGGEDAFQCAYPDIVPYPDPSVTEPVDTRPSDGYNIRTPLWSRQFRHQLRLNVLSYARDRGIMHPEKIGPMTHWFFRTPPEFLKAKKPDFMPQITCFYDEPSGRAWDVRDPKWYAEYWRLTEALCSAYGEPGMFFNPGFDERTVYSNRADNVALKMDIIRRYDEELHRRRPDVPVVLEGWDFQMGWRPEEMRRLVKALDPSYTVIWNFTADVVDFNPGPAIPRDNVFTEWGVTNAFPYTFGYMLDFCRGMDIRGQYGIIRKRERAIVGDPMCKGYLIWPENSHSDIFAWRYFTDNCWNLSPKSTDELLAEFCRDRYGRQAESFLRIWKLVLPISQISGARDGGCSTWGRTCAHMFAALGPNLRNNPERWLDSVTQGELGNAAEAFRALAELDWNGTAVRRDSIDLARTVLDRAAWSAYEEMMKSYHLCAKGAATSAEVASRAVRCVGIVKAFADILALHGDYSVSESLDRLDALERIRNPDAEHVLFENSSCGYCLSHHAEYARGCYVPMVEDMAKMLVARAKAGDFSPLPPVADARDAMRGRRHPVRDFAPDASLRTPDVYRSSMLATAMLLEKGTLEK